MKMSTYLNSYQQVFALPRVRSLLLAALLARLPVTAASITLTLYVVLELDHGYAAAGIVATALNIGSVIGAPLLGRLIDRRGLRLVLAIASCVEVVFWTGAAQLPYPLLVIAAFGGGLLALPVFSVVRQSLAALVPEQQRRPAYALDSMSVEMSFMIAPAAAVLLVTAVSAYATMCAVGAGYLLAGLILFGLNPPTREAGGSPALRPTPHREWLQPGLIAVLAVAGATALVLAGTEVSVIAALRQSGQPEWTGLVLVVWGGASVVGGFVHGAVCRPLSPLVLLGLLSLLTIPVGLAGDWWWLGLALLPAGTLCAPTMAAATETVSKLVPAGVRGEAMGLHGSAMMIGLAVGSSLTGAIIDAAGPGWGFAAAGAVGGLLVLAAAGTQLLGRARHRPGADQATISGRSGRQQRQITHCRCWQPGGSAQLAGRGGTMNEWRHRTARR